MAFSISQTDDLPFDRKQVNKLVLQLKSCDDDRKISNLKLELFKMMKRLIVKNIHNLKMLYRNSKISSECPEDFEIESECFLIMDKCLSNFKVNKTNCFYFYYNKSLMRNLYRMFSKEIRMSDKYQEYQGFEMNKSTKDFKNNDY